MARQTCALLREFSATRRARTALSQDSVPPFRADLLCQEASDAPWPPARTAPDLCKCWKSLSRGECAVRASQVSEQIRGALRSRSSVQQVFPASGADTFRARQLRPQKARRNWAASQSSALPLPQCPPLTAALAVPTKHLPQSPRQASLQRRAPPPPMVRTFQSPQKNSVIALQPLPHRLSARCVTLSRRPFRSPQMESLQSAARNSWRMS